MSTKNNRKKLTNDNNKNNKHTHKHKPKRNNLPALLPPKKRSLNLMPGIGYNAEQKLRAQGIHSLLELAHSKSGRATQAQSILTNNPIFMPNVLSEGCAYLDIESMSFHQDVFLIGILYKPDDNSTHRYVPLYNNTEQKLAKMYNKFIKENMPNCHTIYHWSSYDAVNLRRMNCGYLDCLHNMLPAFKKACILPLSSYSIKVVADYCGYYKYDDTEVSAVECGNLWNRYVKTGDKVSLEKMLEYNRFDCEAMAAVYAWYYKKKWPYKV